jgi:hypothetical protein
VLVFKVVVVVVVVVVVAAMETMEALKLKTCRWAEGVVFVLQNAFALCSQPESLCCIPSFARQPTS